MQKILLQLDVDSQPSVFDAVTALDSADCALLRHGQVTPENVIPLVHGCMFTRSPKELHNTAIFIGGSSMESAEKILKVVHQTQWDPLNVSVMFDPNGCNTTAAAAIYNIASNVDIKGKKIVILSGTGPVGQRAAGLSLKLGATVLLTSRNKEKGQGAVRAIEERFGGQCQCAVMKEEGELPPILEDAVAVLCCGAAGIRLIPEEMWRRHPSLKVVADVNAVPPYGLEGTETQWCGHQVDGKLVFGAIGIGWLKMKIHHLAIARLFESKGLLLDTEGIYELAPSAMGS